MYRIIGSDGKQYGPVSAEQMRQWLAEGRINAKTSVQAEGTLQWKTLAEFPELFSAQGMNPTPPLPDSRMNSGNRGGEQVNGPAIGLMVTAILGFAVQALSFLGNLLGFSRGFGGAADAGINFLTGTIGLVLNVIAIGIGVVILVGALKMKKLESHNWGMAASVLALIPCISPCCIVGLPIGIWSLVVLAKPEVKGAFR